MLAPAPAEPDLVSWKLIFFSQMGEEKEYGNDGMAGWMGHWFRWPTVALKYTKSLLLRRWVGIVP